MVIICYEYYDQLIIIKLFSILRFLEDLKASSKDPEVKKRLEQLLASTSAEELKRHFIGEEELTTICQGLLVKQNLWFKKKSESETEVLILNWHQVQRGSCTLDLATILAQSPANHWDDIVQSYCSVLNCEGESVKDAQLRKEVATRGCVYALFVLSTVSETVVSAEILQKLLSLC